MENPQSWDPDRYARNARFVSDLGMPVVELLAAQPRERVLDLGCGDGVLTAKLMAMGCEVVGVDASEAQIRGARELGVDARAMDGEHLTFANEFDAVFSNAALHWMRRPDDVIAGVHRALRSRGRFVAEMGGHRCVEKIRIALIDALNRRGLDGEGAAPWYFPTVEEYSDRLIKGGFIVKYIALIPRPTPLPGDISGWLETFAENFISKLAPVERLAFIAEVREVLRPQLCDASGKWIADYTRLRFAAHRAD
jgi:trans-aconitate methyltransferase